MSEKTKWSSGPWSPGHMVDSETPCNCRGIVNQVYAGGIATVHKDNGIRLISEGGNDCPPEEEAIANAHLIASAPMLYEALEQLLDDMGDDGLCVCPAAKQQAIAALSLARGHTDGQENR